MRARVVGQRRSVVLYRNPGLPVRQISRSSSATQGELVEKLDLLQARLGEFRGKATPAFYLTWRGGEAAINSMLTSGYRLLADTRRELNELPNLGAFARQRLYDNCDRFLRQELDPCLRALNEFLAASSRT